MTSTPNYITPEGLKKLREEYQELLNVERPKTVEVVAWAASNGDRSENGDYIYGKRRLREIDRRLRFLSQRIEKAHVIDPKTVKSEKVVFGATVTVENEDGLVNTYQIVGEDEIDLKNNKISWRSPLATAILNKRVGDEVIVKRPAGEVALVIVAIEFV